MVRYRVALVCAPLVGALSVASAIAQVSTQGAVGAALGAPAQPKVAAPPAASTVKPGDGAADLDTAARAAALKAAIERCDIPGTLASGGSAQDVTRIAAALRPYLHIDPSSAAWIQTNGRLALAARTTAGNSMLVNTGVQSGGFTPPGGLASLPTQAEAFGPDPAPQTSTDPIYIELGKQAVQGVAAKDLATEYFAQAPRTQYSDSAADAEQAWYGPTTGTGGGGVSLYIPTFNGQTQRGIVPVVLPGTESMIGRQDVLPQIPQGLSVPPWVKDLPPSPPPPPLPPPVTQC